MKKVLIIVCLLLIVCGCTTSNNSTTESQANVLENILKKDNYVVVDVRTKDEYKTGHVKDALNIPYDKIDKADLEKDKTILVYCQSGKRSSLAYNTLKNLGYDVYDLGAYENVTLEKVKK